MANFLKVVKKQRLLLLYWIFIAMPLIAQEKSLEEIIFQIKTSTDTEQIKILETELFQYKLTTESEINVLFNELNDGKISPLIQNIIASISNPEFGGIIYREFKKLKPDFKNFTREELNKPSQDEKSKFIEKTMKMISLIRALAGTRYIQAIPDLREFLNYTGNFQDLLSLESSFGLAKMNDEQSLDMIVSDPHKYENASLAGYGITGIEKIVKEIKNVKNNNNSIDKIYRLLSKLENIGSRDKEIKNALRLLLNHEDKDINYSVSKALISVMDSADKDITLEMLRHKHPLVRITGLNSLFMAKTWDSGSLPLLIEMLQNDSDINVRGQIMEVLRILQQMGVKRENLASAVPYIETLLKESDSLIKSKCFLTLRVLTGRFYQYENMPDEYKQLMINEPGYLPEDANLKF